LKTIGWIFRVLGFKPLITSPISGNELEIICFSLAEELMLKLENSFRRFDLMEIVKIQLSYKRVEIAGLKMRGE